MNHTVKLNNGREVLAKWYQGQLMAVTYSNWTQAKRKVAELGAGWATVCWGRPIYIAKEQAA